MASTSIHYARTEPKVVLVAPLDDRPCAVIRNWDSSVCSTHNLREWSIASALRVDRIDPQFADITRGRHHADTYIPCWPDTLAVSLPVTRLRGQQYPPRRSAALSRSAALKG